MTTTRPPRWSVINDYVRTKYERLQESHRAYEWHWALGGVFR